MTTILIWFAVVIAVEAFVEIVLDSDMPLIAVIRNFLIKINPGFLGKLLKCGYCFSVWVSIPVVFFLPGHLTNIFAIDIILKVLLLHRLSNIAHELMSRLFARLPFEIVINNVNNPGFSDPIVEVKDDPEDPIEPKQ
jgi:hypothetical protein